MLAINHILQKSLVTGKLRLSLLTCVLHGYIYTAHGLKKTKTNHKHINIKQQITAASNQNCQNICSMLAVYS